jgi:hypothetical protein
MRMMSRMMRAIEMNVSSQIKLFLHGTLLRYLQRKISYRSRGLGNSWTFLVLDEGTSSQDSFRSRCILINAFISKSFLNKYYPTP